MGVRYESRGLVHFCRAVKFETVGTNAPVFENGDAKFAISNMELCELTGFTGIGSPKAQTIRDSGDVCGARNTQFEQEFFGVFRAETVSAYNWRDRIGDFCVADYLAELDMVHVMRYSTRFSLHLGRLSSRPPNQR